MHFRLPTLFKETFRELFSNYSAFYVSGKLFIEIILQKILQLNTICSSWMWKSLKNINAKYIVNYGHCFLVYIRIWSPKRLLNYHAILIPPYSFRIPKTSQRYLLIFCHNNTECVSFFKTLYIFVVFINFWRLDYKIKRSL